MSMTSYLSSGSNIKLWSRNFPISNQFLLSNPNVAIELYKEDYNQAIKLLEDLRDGNNQLSELDYAEDDPETPYDESKANGVSFSSNPKRQNFF